MIQFLLERPVMIVGFICLSWAVYNMIYLFFLTKKVNDKSGNIMNSYISTKLRKRYKSYRYNEMEL